MSQQNKHATLRMITIPYTRVSIKFHVLNNKIIIKYKQNLCPMRRSYIRLAISKSDIGMTRCDRTLVRARDSRQSTHGRQDETSILSKHIDIQWYIMIYITQRYLYRISSRCRKCCAHVNHGNDTLCTTGSMGPFSDIVRWAGERISLSYVFDNTQDVGVNPSPDKRGEPRLWQRRDPDPRIECMSHRIHRNRTRSGSVYQISLRETSCHGY